MKLGMGVILGLACLLGASGLASGQGGQGIVMRALDEPVTLDIPEAPIEEVLRKITDKTGLKVTLTEDAIAHLPYGEQTRLRLQIRNAPLREALDRIVQPVALQWEPTDRGVLVGPTPELLRINRRPTFTELTILGQLNAVQVTREKPLLDTLRQATKTPELNIIWHTVSQEEQSRAIAAAEQRLPLSGKDYLDALSHGTGMTWYVWGTSIIILPQELQTIRQLGARVSLRYQNQPLLAVLTDLTRQAHLKLELDPGVLGLLPINQRENFTLLVGESTVDQALEAISGATGLQFTPGKLAIHVSASDALQQQAGITTASRPRPTFIVSMPFTLPDGRTVTVMFRPDDLPADMARQIDQFRNDQLRQWRQQYGPPPATQPAP